MSLKNTIEVPLGNGDTAKCTIELSHDRPKSPEHKIDSLTALTAQVAKALSQQPVGKRNEDVWGGSEYTTKDAFGSSVCTGLSPRQEVPQPASIFSEYKCGWPSPPSAVFHTQNVFSQSELGAPPPPPASQRWTVSPSFKWGSLPPQPDVSPPQSAFPLSEYGDFSPPPPAVPQPWRPIQLPAQWSASVPKEQVVLHAESTIDLQVKLCGQYQHHGTVLVKTRPEAYFSSIFEVVAGELGVSPARLDFRIGWKRITGSDTAAGLDIWDGDTISVTVVE